MSKYEYDMVVIGGGAAGLTASTFAGQSGAKTLLIEKAEKLGGDCLHYGCVPSKTLIKSSSVYKTILNSEKYGLPQADIPEVDFKKIKERIQDVIREIQKRDDPDHIKINYNVETKFGEASFIDDHTIEISGENVTSRYFVIASGSYPMVPPVEGIKDIEYLTNMDIFSLEELPEDMIVVGGGPIGIEIAQAFNRLGSKVSVVEYADCILPKEDQDTSRFLGNLLKEEGVGIFTKTKAVKCETEGSKIKLLIEKDGETKTLESEKILIATGRIPNIKSLNLEKAGIEYDKRGIKVNGKMQTSIKHIYACGDVTGGYQFTHIASYEAIVALYNSILKIPKKTDYSKVTWCTYTDPQVASIGLNETMTKQKGIEYEVFKQDLSKNDRALAEGENAGFIKMILDKRSKVIGVQIVAHNAGDLIAEWIPVINSKGKLSDISEAIHPYPTMAEINKDASVKYMVSKIPAWTKKISKFLFGYRGEI